MIKRWWRWQTARCPSCDGLRWFNLRHGEDCWWWAT